MPMERDRYPKNWNALSRAIKDQVNWICQRCGKQCRKERELLETFAQRVAMPNSEAWQEVMDYPQRFCLTVAHLDQNPANNEPANLLPLCAPCHLDYDRRFIPQNAYAKRERRGQIPLELGAKSMLVVSPTRTQQSACLHPNAVVQGNSAHCPDCEQTFTKRSKAYKEIASREPSQTRPPARRIEANGDSWNNSPEGIEFWKRVDQVWPFLTQEEQHHIYFTQAFDYPRAFDQLESAEARRKIEIPLEPLPLELNDLESERERLVALALRLAKAAEFAPESGWIETGMVKGKSFKQAWWRGNFANGKKTIYIGRVGSPEYGKARSAQQARKQLKKVLRQIEQLKKESDYAVS